MVFFKFSFHFNDVLPTIGCLMVPYLVRLGTAPSFWPPFAVSAPRRGKAATGACAAGSGGPGGSAELLRSWQRCRQARARPKQTADAFAPSVETVETDAMEWCCGDMRCMTRLLELQPTLKEGMQRS